MRLRLPVSGFRLVRVALHYALLLLLATICLFPFWWTVVMAFSGSGTLFGSSPSLWLRDPTFEHVREVFRVIPLWAFLGNSLLISTLTVSGKLCLCTLAAFALSRYRFRGRRLALALLAATLVLPSEVNFLVNFITLAHLGLLDRYLGVVLPNLVSAVSIFLLKQGFDSVPADLPDAARIDGASEMRIFYCIVLPLLAPWLATVGMLTAVESWNDYLWPSIVLAKPEDFPLSAGVLYLRGTYGSSTRVIAAGTILTLAPILGMFLMTQRFFMRGLDGAVK